MNQNELDILKDDFYEALSDREWYDCEQIINKIKNEAKHLHNTGEINLSHSLSYFAQTLELELEDERELINAESKGSEDGQDRLQDNYNPNA
jgi:hypothetical protein